MPLIDVESPPGGVFIARFGYGTSPVRVKNELSFMVICKKYVEHVRCVIRGQAIRCIRYIVETSPNGGIHPDGTPLSLVFV